MPTRSSCSPTRRGLFTADPKQDEDASLIEEIVEVDAALERVAGGAGTARGSGGMASKLAAAKIAAWSGVRVVIAAASAVDVVVDALAGKPVGTAFAPRSQRLSSRKLWIAFAQGAKGRIVVDDGARNALVHAGRSLLAAGVREDRRPVRRRRRGRDRRRAGLGLRQGPDAATRPRSSARSRAAARPTSPRASRTKSSTATTWSCCPESPILDRAVKRYADRMTTVEELGRRAQAASRVLATAPTAAKNAALLTAADLLLERAGEIQAANAADLEAATAAGMAAGPLDRLRLTDARLEGMAGGLRTVAALVDPIGEVLDGWTPPNGLQITRVRVPLGVVAIIYENRPNVTSDAAGLVPEVGQRGAAARLVERVALERRGRLGAARGARQARPAGRRGAARRGHRVRDRDRR